MNKYIIIILEEIIKSVNKGIIINDKLKFKRMQEVIVISNNESVNDKVEFLIIKFNENKMLIKIITLFRIKKNLIFKINLIGLLEILFIEWFTRSLLLLKNYI